MIDLRYVKKLLEMLDESTVDSMEISSDKGMRIRLSKTATVRPGAVYAAPAAAPVPVAAPAAAAPAAPAGSSEPAPTAGGNATDVKSPMVGTYYGAPEPGAKPYVSVGQQVKQGQVLCIIEAMKIMNEIEADTAGTITRILCDNGQAVEFGQPLFVVE